MWMVALCTALACPALKTPKTPCSFGHATHSFGHATLVPVVQAKQPYLASASTRSRKIPVEEQLEFVTHIFFVITVVDSGLAVRGGWRRWRKAASARRGATSTAAFAGGLAGMDHDAGRCQHRRASRGACKGCSAVGSNSVACKLVVHGHCPLVVRLCLAQVAFAERQRPCEHDVARIPLLCTITVHVPIAQNGKGRQRVDDCLVALTKAPR